VAVIQGTDERDLWRRDLDALLETLDAEDAKMDTRASLLAKQKTAAGGRKVGPAIKCQENLTPTGAESRRRLHHVRAGMQVQKTFSQGTPPATQPMQQLLEWL
jgi:hypothetical protein